MLLKTFFKRLVGSITITEDKIAILPYKTLKRFKKVKMYFIRKVLEKLDVQVVLSKYLSKIDGLENSLNRANIKTIKGNKLINYLYVPIIKYICKIKNEEIYKQEITILAKKYSVLLEEQIVEIAKEVKRIQIVTTNIKQFENLEYKLNDIVGIPCQVTNNKRKSLLNSKNIINIDFDEETLNKYNINRNAIVINIANNIKINSKLFNGINVYDYQIKYDNVFDDSKYSLFDKKALYESTLNNKNYTQSIEKLKKDNVRIVNLVGKNGVINIREFLKN